MSLKRSFLDESLEAWGHIREGTIAEVENIPDEKFDYRPAPEARSVKEIVVHILEMSIFLMSELPRDDTDLKRMPFGELVKSYAGRAYEAETKAELLELLKSQITEGIEKFRDFGDLAMWQSMVQFDDSRATKHQWFHHLLTEEMYHRGQLAIYARLIGVEPALTKMIRGSDG